MSEDMGEKIKQIAEALGGNSANMPDNMKGILNMLMSSTSSKEEGSSDDRSQKPETKESSSNTNSDDLADMSRKMKKAMNLLSTGSDPRVNLLNAIRPYLNQNRQRKLQTCLKLIKLGSLTKLMDDVEERSV